MGYVIYRLAQDETPQRHSFEEYILDGCRVIERIYPGNDRHTSYMRALSERAVLCAGNKDSDSNNVMKLGEGWVGEEALAIGLYCALRHMDDFESAMRASVNHGGDSDSTGAVTGNILGAAVGYGAIPDFYKKDLEFHDLLVDIADDLYHGKAS